MTSAVSVLVIDWTTMGLAPPTLTVPMVACAERRRGLAGMNPYCIVERSRRSRVVTGCPEEEEGIAGAMERGWCAIVDEIARPRSECRRSQHGAEAGTGAVEPCVHADPVH